MAQAISSLFPFCANDELQFSTSETDFHEQAINANLQNLISPSYIFSEFSSCKLIKSLHFTEDIFRQIFPHQHPSSDLWATTFRISDQELLFAIFVPFGLIIWNNSNQKSRFYDIKPVEKRKAAFIHCQISVSLIFAYEGDSKLYAVHNVENLKDETISTLDLQHEILTFGKVRPELALVITKNQEAVIVDVPSMTKQSSFSLSFTEKWNPLRKTLIHDTLLFTTVTDENHDEFYELIVALSSKQLSLFQLDETATNFNRIHSITTKRGTPLFISIIRNTAFLILDASQQGYTFLRIDDIYSSHSEVHEITLNLTEEIISLIAIEPNLCCILTRYNLHFCIVNEIDSIISIVLSKTSTDYILTGSLISDHILSILTASEGNYIIEVDTIEQLLSSLPYQINNIAQALTILDDTSSESIYDDAIALLEKAHVSNQAFLTLDKRFTTFVPKHPIENQLVHHLKLVSLFNLLTDQGKEETVERELEINAYNLICLKVTEKYFEKETSFEFDAIRNVTRQRDLSVIFEFIHNDLSSHTFKLIPLLHQFIIECYENHYKENDDIYRSEIKCHPEVIELLNESLSAVSSSEDWIANNITRYSELCLFSFILLNDKEKSIQYTMNLFKTDQISIETIEHLALEFDAYELLAEIIHQCDQFAEKSRFYYEHFKGHIRPILEYMKHNNWIWDILQLGEIPEYRNDVTQLLADFDSLTLAFHFITEDCRDMDKAAQLLWAISRECMENKRFTLEESATFLSLALMSCSLLIPEKPTRKSQSFIKLYEQIQNKLILLEYQNKLFTKPENAHMVYVMASDEIIDVFLKKEDPTLALSALTLSFSERDEGKNGRYLALIFGLYATQLEDKINTPIRQLPLYQIIVDSRLPAVPSNFEIELEKCVRNTQVKDLIIRLVSEAVNSIHA